jgi:hypothetical protein
MYTDPAGFEPAITALGGQCLILAGQRIQFILSSRLYFLEEISILCKCVGVANC